jgi:hypothetical protein
VSPGCERSDGLPEKSFGCSVIPFLGQLSRRFAAHGFVGPMFVEMPFESIEGRIQHRRGVEVPAIDRLGFDRATRAFDQAVGPGVIGLGETVPDVAPPTVLGEGMDLGGTAPFRPR